MGCLMPNARNLTEFWRSLRRGQDGIREVPPTHWSPEDYFDADPKRPDHIYCTRGGFLSPVPFDPTEFGIPPTILEATDTTQLLSLVVAKAALEDAGYGEDRDFNRDRVGVFLGITGTQELVIPLAARLGHPLWRRALAEAGVSPEIADDVIARIADGYVSWQENSFPGLLGNVVAGRIANRLNLRGTNCVVDAACASSLGAAHLAMLELAAGRCDMALTGGADTLNDIFMHMCFSKTPALSPTGDARPFDEGADGTVLGEGIGMLILKRLDDAQRDGDRIYAVVRAIGASSDGRSQSIYAPHSAGQARCLRNAYAAAGFEPETVDLIEAHGTGTKVGDASEFEALKAVFRESRGDGTWCALGSVKSQIGHTKAAAGAAGLIKAALALYHRSLPPTIKIKRPNPNLGIEQSPFYLNTQARPWVTGENRPRRAGVSSFGFGGSNFHAVLEEQPTAVVEPAWDGSVQIIAISAESVEGLRESVAIWRRRAVADDFDDAHLAYHAAASRLSFRGTHAHRLLFTVEAGDDVVARLAAAEETIASDPAKHDPSANRSGIYHGTGSAGKLVFLFPGQGSQYLGMARELACTFPELIATLEEAGRDADFDEPAVGDLIYPRPAFDEDSKGRQTATLSRTENAQRALGTIDLGMARLLERFGVRPDFTSGHSYGELVALCAAGRFDAATLHRLSRLRGRLMAAGDGDRGAMLAVQGPLEKISQFIEEEKLAVVLANRNSPKQGVLSGPREEIARAAAACKTRGLSCKTLNVSAAFHTSSMQSALTPLRNALEAVEFADGRCPVFANTTGDAYPARAAAAKDLLAHQLVRPVDFVKQIEALYSAGARTFVEVGPKAVLTGLVGAILVDQPHVAIPLDPSAGRDSGVAELARILARLAAMGYPVELSRWERAVAEPRKPKMVVPLVGANYRAPPTKKAAIKAKASGRADRSIVDTTTRRELPPLARDPSVMMEIDRKMVSLRTPAKMDEPNNAPPAPRELFEPNVPPAGPSTPTPNQNPMLTDALRLIQDGLRSMQALQRQTAAAHERFLQSQEQAHRAIQSMLEGQQRLVAQSMGWATPTPSAPIAEPPQKSANRDPQSAIPPGDRPEIAQPVVSPSTEVAACVTPSELGIPHSEFSSIESVVLEIVGEKTGYPREMINLDMDIEADLGIDSIKRVEIVAAIEEKLPELSSVKPEQMGGLRTLRQIVAFMAPVAVDSADARPAIALPITEPGPAIDFAGTLLEVVAQLTGYPREMLNLEMDLEADLGIDSIKRVEILAGVESKIPRLPPVKPEYMGGLRTLGQIVEYYASSMPTRAPKATAATTPASVPAKPAPSARVPRSVLQLVDLPPAEDVGLQLAPGRAIWIADDDPSLALHLQGQFQIRGIQAAVLAVDEIARCGGDARIGGLILLASSRTAPDGLWTRESEVALRNAFRAAKSVATSLPAAAKDGDALFVTISRMDGAFGLAGGDFDPTSGGLAGLAKTAACEWPDVDCRAFDVARDWSDEVAADAIVQELLSDGPVEIGLSPNRRRGLKLTPIAAAPEAIDIQSGDVFMVTGGARGVTAEVSVELARIGRPTLVILGRSPRPADEPDWLKPLSNEAAIKQAILRHEFAGRANAGPAELKSAFDRYMAAREVRGNLARIAAAGATVQYECVDVRNAASLRLVVEKVRRDWGPIRGLIHAAGVLEDRLIKDKTAEQFDRVLDTKAAGLRNLLDAINREELRHLILFSSVSARFGNVGQADYAMANEVLNKAARRLAASLPNCKVVSLNWGPWDGGMVGPALKREFERRGVELIPLEAGARCFVEEMANGDRPVEVVLGGGLIPISPTVKRRRGAMATQTSDSGFHVAFERRIDLSRHDFLRAHVIGGRPVLPAAMTMEWLAHAALHANPGLVLHGMDDFQVLKGVVIHDRPVALRFHASKARRSGELFEIDVAMRGTDAHGREIPHAKAAVVLASRRPDPPQTSMDSSLAERPCSKSINEIYAEVLFHGRQLEGLMAIRGIGPRGLIADVATAPPPGEWMADPLRGAWLTDPLAVDAAFQAAIVWCREELGAPSLPSRLGRYRQYRQAFPADGVTIAFDVHRSSAHGVSADIGFFDADGRLVATMDGYECTVDASLIPAFQRRTLAGAVS